MKLIFATHNAGKVQEMRQILSGLPLDIVPADEAGVTEDLPETGSTCEENALQKARYVSKKTGEAAFADDTGLFIDALGGQPGIHAARWAEQGDHASKTLAALHGVPQEKRTAQFVSLVALVSPDGEEHLFKGAVEGTITDTPHGQAHPHLPYDTVFMPREDTRTFAQMSSDEKNAISHRGRAFQEFRKYLLSVI